MNKRLYPLAIPLILLLGACRAQVAEYSEAEAPNDVIIDSAASEFQVKFAPYSAHLARGEAAVLRHLAMTGAIKPSDRITVSAAGSKWLAERRTLAISHELLKYGIVADARRLAWVAPNSALVKIGRYLVTLPPCPNWSKPPAHDFTNATSSNFGCATASNLALMVASPADLVSGRTLEPADGKPAAAAVNTYLNNKVQLPSANAALPLASTSQAAAGGGAPAAGGSQ
jgi:pilus assembly protein CpaD